MTYDCTYMSSLKMKVDMAPFVAVPHRKMHDNQINVALVSCHAQPPVRVRAGVDSRVLATPASRPDLR